MEARLAIWGWGVRRPKYFAIYYKRSLQGNLRICEGNLWAFSGKTIHYNDVIMGAIASQITSLTIVYSTVYSDTDQGKHQSSASLAFVRGIHRSPVNSSHKWPVTRKMFPFDDVIMLCQSVGTLLFYHSTLMITILYAISSFYMSHS